MAVRRKNNAPNLKYLAMFGLVECYPSEYYGESSEDRQADQSEFPVLHRSTLSNQPQNQLIRRRCTEGILPSLTIYFRFCRWFSIVVDRHTPFLVLSRRFRWGNPVLRPSPGPSRHAGGACPGESGWYESWFF